jgi:hypothetical protein
LDRKVRELSEPAFESLAMTKANTEMRHSRVEGGVEGRVPLSPNVMLCNMNYENLMAILQGKKQSARKRKAEKTQRKPVTEAERGFE